MHLRGGTAPDCRLIGSLVNQISDYTSFLRGGTVIPMNLALTFPTRRYGYKSGAASRRRRFI